MHWLSNSDDQSNSGNCQSHSDEYQLHSESVDKTLTNVGQILTMHWFWMITISAQNISR